MSQRNNVGAQALAFLRCGACRYVAIYFLPFYVALLSTGHGGWGWIGWGILYWTLLSFGTELLNRLSDRAEDRINRPGRVALCGTLGYGRIRTITVALWAALLVLSLAWLIVLPNLILAILIVLGVLSAINYSIGVRFKTKRLLCQIILTFPFFGSFLLGWFADNPALAQPSVWRSFLTQPAPVVVVVGLFIATLIGGKDITDHRGDEEVGYRSFFVWLIRDHDIRAVLAVLAVPFGVLLLYVVVGALPARFLALLGFLPFSVLYALGVTQARDDREQRAVKEYLYHYWFVFMAAALYLYWPRPQTLLVVAAVAIYWILTSRYLHWTDGFRAWQAAALVAIVDRSRRRPGRPWGQPLRHGLGDER